MVIKVIELVGSSTKSWDDAVRSALQEASESLRHIRAVDVIKQSLRVDDRGEISEYRITLHIAFRVEHHSHLMSEYAMH